MSLAPNLAFSTLTDEEALRVLRENKIGLTPAEARQVETLLGRAPTLTEAIIWGIQGSEHCSYKSTRHLLKTLPTKAPQVMLGVGEDSGIVELATNNKGEKYGLIMAHESHNHPSQVVPYEGAATGVGGIVRDIIVMGGRPIASADPLRFGQIDRHLSRSIARDVISGISGYGNPLGVPNIAGDTYFDDSFNDNCLVNVMALGALREDEIIHSYAPANAEGYDIIVVGKPTDQSGMGGAAFSSLTLKEEEKEINKGAVQEPNPFLERHLIESTLALFAKLKAQNALGKVGFKDMGAGGITCASVELVEAGGYGADIDLSKVHVSLENLHPSVIACAETQERLCWIAAPELTDMILAHYNQEWDLPKASFGAKASVIGKVKKGNYTVRYHDEILVDAKPSDITQGVTVNRPSQTPNRSFAEPEFTPPDLSEIFLKLLASENIASRLPIFENYDKVVQGQTLIESGMADAGVVLPFRHRDEAPEIHKVGAAISVDSNPRHGKISPYWGAANAVVESMRNVAAVGATPWAATDCLNFGNPEKPEQMWEIEEAVRGMKDALEGVGQLTFNQALPLISGNVSLYNESKNGAVAPSLIIGMVGRLEDAYKAVTLELKKPGNTLFLLGPRKNELGASEYYRLLGHLGANVPQPDFAQVRRELETVISGIEHGIIVSAHDISEGGLAICLAEMAIGGRGQGKYGLDVTLTDLNSLRLDQYLFTETGGFVIEVSDAETFKQEHPEAIELGTVTAEPRFKLQDLDFPLDQIKDLWLNGLRNKLNA